MSLAVIPSYADMISFTTDKSEYLYGDTIKVSGKITSYEKGQFVSLQILNPSGSDFATVDMFIPKNDGTFLKTYQANGPKWDVVGKYEIKLFYGGSDSSKFVKISKIQETPQTTKNTQPQDVQENPIEQPKPQKLTIDETKTSSLSSKTKVPGFPDFDKSPQYYFERYQNEPEFKSWFDSTFPRMTIDDVVGYQKTKIPNFPDNEKPPKYYLDRYFFESDYKEWFDSQFPDKSIFNVLGFPDPIPVPAWIKNNAKWWAEGQIDDANFISGIQFLIQNRIIIVSDVSVTSQTSDDSIPLWVKNNAKWWSEGLISETDFLNGLEHLIEHGIIKI